MTSACSSALTTRKIWLDTDIGGDIDDALCLAYLLRQPACELVGISTVGGEAERRAMVADAICHAAGRQDIPVYAGADRQLMPSSVCPTPDGASRLPDWPHRKIDKKDQAVDAMRRAIREQPHELSLLAVGHLTNIALLFRLDPEIPRLLKELHIMSGVFSPALEAGPDMPMGNWNAWLDRHACAIVYDADVPIRRTFGLNVTSQLALTQEAKPGLFESNRLMRAVGDFGSPWLASHAMTFHDPLAAACLFEPQLCAYQRGAISVDYTNVDTFGEMAFQPSTSNNSDDIAVTVDRERFFEHYFAITCGGR
ncbi:purine nucleosidase [Paenibacillus taihuensis]|uniref:Purine nucleosidase n=1 Tax=Paenibacillus taihuensis TaxID=1156355 RepID=A0A3D9Q6F8_9BACL|nr:nucleoside hydrolase [Paenibacillus taihuensis]REE56434.1 purine nucleosidase [Paenibacillus taihuensis]